MSNSFDEYAQSIDFLVMVGEPREDRIRAAWQAGGGSGPVVHPLCPSPYLYDQLRDAFRLAR